MNDELHGIIIDYREYQEHDALLVLLDEHGRQTSIFARGIQKIKSKNAPACQLFTKSNLILNYKERISLQSLKTAELIQSYHHIRDDLYKQSAAAYFCEILLHSHFEMIAAYQLLDECLNILQSADEVYSILCLFQAMVNRMHGIEMICDYCVRCHTQHQIYAVSLRDGGFICRQCAKRYDKAFHREDLKKIRLLSKAQLTHYDIIHKQALTFQHFELLYQFFAEYAGITIKSFSFLQLLMKIK